MKDRFKQGFWYIFYGVLATHTVTLMTSHSKYILAGMSAVISRARLRSFNRQSKAHLPNHEEWVQAIIQNAAGRNKGDP